MKNENVVEDMIDILTEVQKYVPVKPVETVDEQTQKTVAADVFHTILIGGDQVTRRWVETAKDLRRNSTTPATELKGLMPICEDWHAKGIFLEVS